MLNDNLNNPLSKEIHSSFNQFQPYTILTFQAQWCQMVTLQIVLGCTGLTHPFKFFLFLSARVPECQKIKKSGLDQYGTERFDGLIFATI